MEHDKANSPKILSEMNERSREIFQRVVETYIMTGDPVGSRSLTRDLSENISAATVRNVMQDLEYLGLLASPHISAGRVPTQTGLRMFVDAIMEVGELPSEDAHALKASVSEKDTEIGSVLDRVGSALSGLTNGASLVLAPKQEAPIKHIEFVSLSVDRALVVLVFADGQVENRVFQPPAGYTASALREASNFLSMLAEGKTISELRSSIEHQISTHRRDLDDLAKNLVEEGLAVWDGEPGNYERLIVRGRANLLHETENSESLDRIRTLFDDLERKRDIAKFLELTEKGEGVRIFIGSENKLFSLSGSALVVSPYMNADRKIIGAVGVIGPTRLNYGRIVPIVDYTAQLVGKLVSESG